MCLNKCIKLSNKDFFIFYPKNAPKNVYHINISGYRDLFLWRLEYQTFKWVILQKPKWIKYQCYMCWLSFTPIQGVYSLHHNLILQFNQSFGLTPKPQIIVIANTPIGKKQWYYCTLTVTKDTKAKVIAHNKWRWSPKKDP